MSLGFYRTFVVKKFANKLSSSLEKLLFSRTAARCRAFSISTSGMKFISQSSESKLMSDSEAEDILIFWRKFGRFRSKIYKSKYDVPRKQRKMTEGWSIRFLDPDSLKRGRATPRARLWRAVENRGFKQIQNFFRRISLNGKWIHFREKKFLGVRCTLNVTDKC